jgi:outer membrane lipoprotein carrier protein
MKKISVVFIFLWAIMQSAWAGSPDVDLSNLLQKYQAFQANFSQSSFGGKGKGGHSQGRVYMQRPGKFRWETTAPYQQVVVANGGQLWIYDKDLKQVSQQSAAKRGFNPGELLTEPVSDLGQKYTVTMEEGWYKLIPHQQGRGFKMAYLKFAGEQLVGLKVVNQLGQTNVFTFSQVRVNPVLAPGLFNFKAPAGVQVIHG